MALVDLLKGRGLRPATINRHIAMLKAAIHKAYDHRLGVDWHRMIPENYLSGFPTLPENNIKHRILTPEEREKLFRELPDYLQPLFYHATYYPCRKEEVLNIKKTDVDLFRKKIWIPEENSKTGKGRFIPIPPEIVPWIMSTMALPCEYLHAREVRPGVWERINSFRTAYENACERAGITGYNWHKTRQQAAMELMYDGWDSLQVMKVGGWKSMAAFTRYVDVDYIMLDIKQGLFKPDLSWRQKHAPEPIRKAA
jgi:integrase